MHDNPLLKYVCNCVTCGKPFRPRCGRQLNCSPECSAQYCKTGWMRSKANAAAKRRRAVNGRWRLIKHEGKWVDAQTLDGIITDTRPIQ